MSSNSGLIMIGIGLLFAILALWLLARRAPSRRVPGAAKPVEAVPVETNLAAPPGQIAVEPGVLTVAPLIPSDVPAPSEVEIEPAAAPVAEPVAAPGEGPTDPLTIMKGLGPKAAAKLTTLGVTRYAQIAAWSDADVARIDAEMGPFRGRIVRDRWIEQARFLAADDRAGYEATFGKLG